MQFQTPEHGKARVLELPGHLVLPVGQIDQIQNKISFEVLGLEKHLLDLHIDDFIRTEGLAAAFRGAVVISADGLEIG